MAALWPGPEYDWTMQPGEILPFELDDYLQGYADGFAVAVTGAHTTNLPIDLCVESLRAEVNSSGYVELQAEVANCDTVMAENVQLFGIFYDADGEFLKKMWGYSGVDLPPGARESFVMNTYDKPSDLPYASYEAYAKTTNAKPGPACNRSGGEPGYLPYAWVWSCTPAGW